MLIYHPIHDINHCIYRFLRFLETSKHSSLSWDQLKLLDFYSVFPHLLKNIAPLPRELGAYKKIISRIPEAFEAMPNEKRVFYEMMPIQNAAIHNLIARDLVDAKSYAKKIIARSKAPLPEGLADKIICDPFIKEEWYLFLVNELTLVNFDGKGGLKSRSNLMEYRYD
jgi:hypothetical protein